MNDFEGVGIFGEFLVIRGLSREHRLVIGRRGRGDAGREFLRKEIVRPSVRGEVVVGSSVRSGFPIGATLTVGVDSVLSLVQRNLLSGYLLELECRKDN